MELGIRVELSRTYLEAMRNMVTVVAYSGAGGFIAAREVFGSKRIAVAVGVFLGLLGIFGAQSAYLVLSDAIRRLRPRHSHWALEAIFLALAIVMTCVPWLVLNGNFPR